MRGYFGFAGEEYCQIGYRLPSSWPSYVDHVFVIIPRSCIRQTLTQLNVLEKIKFTVKEEEDQKLPFFDTGPSGCQRPAFLVV